MLKPTFLLIFSFLIIRFITFVSSRYCKKINCLDSVAGINDICYSENTINNSTNITYNICPDGYICKVNSFSKQGLCTKDSWSKGLPGVSCSQNSECISNICKFNECEGNKQNEKCTDHIYCNVGLSCQNSVCKLQLGLGELCRSEFDCINSLSCINNVCKTYNSLDNGQITENENNCKSGILSKSKCDSFALLNTQCDYKSDICTYQSKTDKIEFKEECECIDNNLQNGYYCKNYVETNVKTRTNVHTILRFHNDYYTEKTKSICLIKSLYGNHFYSNAFLNIALKDKNLMSITPTSTTTTTTTTPNLGTSTNQNTNSIPTSTAEKKYNCISFYGIYNLGRITDNNNGSDELSLIIKPNTNEYQHTKIICGEWKFQPSSSRGFADRIVLKCPIGEGIFLNLKESDGMQQQGSGFFLPCIDDDPTFYRITFLIKSDDTTTVVSYKSFSVEIPPGNKDNVVYVLILKRTTCDYDKFSFEDKCKLVSNSQYLAVKLLFVILLSLLYNLI